MVGLGGFVAEPALHRRRPRAHASHPVPSGPDSSPRRNRHQPRSLAASSIAPGAALLVSRRTAALLLAGGHSRAPATRYRVFTLGRRRHKRSWRRFVFAQTSHGELTCVGSPVTSAHAPCRYPGSPRRWGLWAVAGQTTQRTNRGWSPL